METITSSNTHGASAAYSYDGLNRLETVVDNNLPGNQTTTYTYDNASNVATVKYPNQLQSNFTYDTLNRLTEMVTPVSGYNYQLGPTGNRTQAVEVTGRTINWSYDGIYRLTNETITDDPAPASNNGSASYTLDPVGNRTSVTSTFSGINPVAGSYNAEDELISSENYDSNGNVLSTGGKSYTYDSENHMTSMTNGGTVVTMVYDAFGNRVGKTVGGVTTHYLVEDDVNPTGLPQVMEEIVGGVVARTYTYGLQRISQNQIIQGAWTPSFYGYDGAGSVRQLTDANGTPTDTYEYDAYGNSFTKSGTTPNNYLYRGEQFDSDLGLYYLRARYYNPNTGRFLSRDPKAGHIKDPASLHKYLYANGDPVNRIDPTGRSALLEGVYLDLNAIRPVPYLIGIAGGTAAQIAEWAATLNAGIALITDLLSEAAAEEAASQFSAAWQVWSESAAAYNELLLETSAQGGITRLLSCTTLGIVYGLVMDEYDSLHPWKGWAAETGTDVGCELNFILLVE